MIAQPNGWILSSAIRFWMLIRFRFNARFRGKQIAISTPRNECVARDTNSFIFNNITLKTCRDRRTVCLDFPSCQGSIQCSAIYGMVAFALFSIRSICARKTRQRLRRHQRQLCTRARKKRKPVMDFPWAYLRQNMSSISLGTESTIRSTICWGNAP
jgi:hypothetical protein